METLARTRFLAPAVGVLVVASWIAQPARGDREAYSSTVLGTSNPLLSDGATALEAGRIQEGLRLTLEGLRLPTPARDASAGHANACAGFVMLKQWDQAMSHCNQALELDPANWHAFNNRAAIYAAQGLYDLAIHDLEAGLEIAPQSQTLHTSMRIVLKDKAITRNRGRKAVAS